MKTNSDDKIKRFIFNNHGVRGEIVRLHNSLQDFSSMGYPECVQKILMELSACAILVASTLKDGSEVMLQIRGQESSPLRYALINVREDLSFYGSAAKNEELNIDENDSILTLFGKDAVLVLSIFPKDGVKWQGIVELKTDSIQSSLMEYFEHSSQLPTHFIIHTDVKQHICGGIMLQIIPEIKDNVNSLEHLTVLSETLSSDEMFSLDHTDILRRLYAYEDVQTFFDKEIAYKCICSKQRCENALEKLSPAELLSMASDPMGTSMTCQHCKRTYTFTKEELMHLYHKISQ